MLALQAVSSAYARAHAARPLATSMALGAVIAGAGDAICQRVEGRRLAGEGGAPGDFSFQRVGELSFVRACVHAPLLFVYFPWLSRLVPGSTWPRVVARVALDSVLGSPLSLIVIFAATSTIKGRPQDAPARIREHLVPTWLLGTSYWPIVHLLNFKFIPPAHQSLVAHFASVWWMVQISAASNSKLAAQAAAAAALAAPATAA